MADCDAAFKERLHHVIDGRAVDVKRAVPLPLQRRNMFTSAAAEARESLTKKDERKIHIRGITDDHTDEDLIDYFSKYGAIECVHIVHDRSTGRRKGFAFVTFEEDAAVERATG
jgi:ribosomal protein S10